MLFDDLVKLEISCFRIHARGHDWIDNFIIHLREDEPCVPNLLEEHIFDWILNYDERWRISIDDYKILDKCAALNLFKG